MYWMWRSFWGVSGAAGTGIAEGLNVPVCFHVIFRVISSVSFGKAAASSMQGIW